MQVTVTEHQSATRIPNVLLVLQQATAVKQLVLLDNPGEPRSFYLLLDVFLYQCRAMLGFSKQLSKPCVCS